MEQAQGAIEITARVGDVGHQGQCPRPLQQGGIGKIRRILLVIISQHSRTDAVERIEPADRRQLLLEIPEHEADQALGLAPLVAGLVARMDGRDRKPAGYRHSRQGRGGGNREAALAAHCLALDEVVKADPQHTGRKLQETDALAVAIVAKVRA